MIKRDITPELLESSREYPVVTLFGPRQSGKTVLAQQCFPDKPYFLLEDPDTRLAAEADPRGFLAQMPDGAILDEIQRLPMLLSYLQGIVDKTPRPGMFILTGSHQPDLHTAVSQSLAGRTALLTLLPLTLEEIRQARAELNVFELIYQGAFPRLHSQQLQPNRFFNGYVQTYVERDVRAILNIKDLSRFQQFLVLLAGRVGQVVNYTSLGNDVGVSSTTIQHWVSVLKASYILFELPPFFANIRKRVIKSPKLYFTDTGLAAFLLGIQSAEQVARDPLRGNLYENLMILEILKAHLNRGLRPDLYFYRDSQGNEVDLLIRQRQGLLPVEIKSSATFSTAFLKGIQTFRADSPDCLPNGVVLYNGEQTHQVAQTRVVNLLRSTAPECLAELIGN
ncbi:MAG: ATP-binding protein [Candidatus Thiothrix putei]|uniref:ATP-binding protein n=1 Tax=Candidatus Thiothrix putei TaxID=3080811 RepID=A0AA95HHI6_9GAMM|nr:MAG: ATP-binding protein [Candidatus Thiothrix putei]